MCRRVCPRSRLARSFITVTKARSSSRVWPVASWEKNENIGAPGPSSMPPLGSITHRRTRPVLMSGAKPAVSDHSTEPLPAPGAPATRMLWPSTGTRHRPPFSVTPTAIADRFTAAPTTGLGNATGCASESPRITVMRIWPGSVAAMMMRSALKAAASASDWLRQLMIDCPVTTLTSRMSECSPIRMPCSTGISWRSPTAALSPHAAHTLSHRDRYRDQRCQYRYGGPITHRWNESSSRTIHSV
ncbi:Uncharacterised protein [Mycobacteroides abscessus subsp. abscessus]|nr:Uncharacterised protein [Mycobacteroides abscessus subsp. abscessus]